MDIPSALNGKPSSGNGIEAISMGDGTYSTLDIYSLNKAIQAYFLHQDEINRATASDLTKLSNCLVSYMSDQKRINNLNNDIINSLSDQITTLHKVILFVALVGCVSPFINLIKSFI